MGDFQITGFASAAVATAQPEFWEIVSDAGHDFPLIELAQMAEAGQGLNVYGNGPASRVGVDRSFS
jgi:hypothetical protein